MPLDGTLYEDDEILRVLRAAQERIRDPKNWCQGVLYRTTDDGTQQWCARGAMYSFIWNAVADDLLCRAASEMGYGSRLSIPGCFGERHEMVELNNTADHQTVMLMFDRAQELRLADMMEVAVV